MDKNLLWKLLFIIICIVAAVWTISPPHQKLQGGLDLTGGSSLIYDFNTQDLLPADIKGLAARNIPILRKRIDPQNMANIVIRPLGDARIEIRLPVANAETRAKRKEYEDALKALDAENVNLIRIKQALGKDKDQRQQTFDEFAGESVERKTILDNLASTFDALTDAEAKRNTFDEELKLITEKIDAASASAGMYIKAVASSWVVLEQQELQKKIDDYAKEDKEEAKPFITDYFVTYKEYSKVLNEIEGTLRLDFRSANNDLAKINLSTVQLKDVLQMNPKSKERQTIIDGLKERFASRADMIDATLEAYTQYAPNAGSLDDPEDLKRMLKGSGKLEFRILPTGDNFSSQTELDGLTEALKTQGPKAATAASNNYMWAEIENIENWRTQGSIVGQFGEKYYVLAGKKPTESLLHGGEKPWKLKRSYPTTDYNTGRRAIGFTFDPMGKRLFYKLTGANVDRPLAILLDDMAISAPNISEAINGKGVITGEYTQVQQEDMINKLNAGSFQTSLSEAPVSEKTIGPGLGAENRDKGINACIWGIAAVAAFMLVYYLLAGAIANTALFMNILFILAMMVTLRATFTLPGIAGIILTIGMSVDANVLIFERIREEQMRGSSLRAAVTNGYQRAFRTIFDANITTFFVALILYMVASEEIKGFAIILMLGIASSMFTALFATRIIFNLLIDNGIIKNHITMLKLIGKPNVNWMGIRKTFFVISTLLIVGGMSVFFLRDEQKNSKYDNEFIGGTSAQLDLKEGSPFKTADDVQTKIREKGNELGIPALEAAKVTSVGDTGNQFEITTTETNKTNATLTFTDKSTPSVETVTAAIEKAMKKIGKLNKLRVTPKGSSFAISTSLVNKARVEQVLTEAFGETATITDLHVSEVVTSAIREAFAGYLETRQNLGGKIVASDKVTDAMPEISDHLGGIKITYQLDIPASYKELKERFKDIQLKPDTEDLQWYTFEILDTDLAPFDAETNVTTFTYVSSHPEAAYRNLAETEWQQYVSNEKTKIVAAVSLQESLSRVTQIDPSIGGQQQIRAIMAIILSLIAIVAYIWIRFGTARYGIAAIAALVHDVSITLGAVALCAWLSTTAFGKMLGIRDFKINLEMIAAFLTIIGYSLNDTIVVFDRIRENRGKNAILTPKIISMSINQTLSRTLLTSFTTFLVVLVMYIWGGVGLRGFTFAMLVGIIVGTYSSIAIAAPILLIGAPDDTTKTE